MWRLALKQVAANRARFVLTALAVVLGVTFVSGTLVLTDTSQKLFDDRFASRNTGWDLTIRAEVAFDEAMGVEVEHDPVPADLVNRVRATPGVQVARGVITGTGSVLIDSVPVESTGEPLLMSWGEPPFGGFSISAGRAPEGPGELVLDNATARRAGIEIGSEVTVQSHRVSEFRLVGVARPNQAAAYEGVSVALTTVSDAQSLLRVGDRFSEIRVAVASGTTVAEVEQRLREDLGGAYAVTSSKDVARASSDAARTQLGYLQGMLLALAVASLLIGGYLIANTFSIVIVQRTRELALLRAAGATAQQVRRLLLAEATVIGVAGSATGTVLGIGAAGALRGLLAGIGADLPTGPATIRPASMMLSFVIGVAVTVVAAVAPSRRAGRVSPLQAMRSAAAVRVTGRARRITGIGAAVVAVVALVAGLGGAAVSVIAVGGVAAVVALAALGPVLAGPLARLVGRPFAALGVSGRLAADFAARSPRRTAATVTALALSIALVVFMSVVAASMKKDITDRYHEVIRADLIVESSGGEMLGGLSPEVYDRIVALPEVEVASRMKLGHVKRGSSSTALAAVDPATVETALRVDTRSGAVSELAKGDVMVSESLAADEGISVGDTVALTFPRDGEQELTVAGVFDDDLMAATQTDYLIGLGTYSQHFAEDVDADVFVTLAPGVDQEAAIAKLERALQDLPNVEVRDQEAASEGRTGLIDDILGLVTVLLLLTVLIAVLGVTNTLALSIVERTREIGMLRAVGMTTRQLGWMVRSEAVLQAALAALLGAVLGVGFAAATVNALGGTDPVATVVPWSWLAAVLAGAAVAGLGAGLLPARRAGRLPLMEAITTA